MKSKKTRFIALGSIAIAALATAGAARAATVLAKVNGQVITLKDFNKRYSENAQFFQANPPSKTSVLDDLIRRDLGIQEAKREGLERDPEVRDEINTVLYHALINKKLSREFDKIHVTDAQAKAYYAQHPEIRTSHIFVAVPPNATPKQVNEAYAQIKKVYDEQVLPGKMDFAEIAQKYSEGPSALMGGDIDYQTENQLDPAYYAAAIKLKIGQVSGIVRSQIGYHIIKLTGKRSWADTDHGAVKRLVIELRRKQIFENYMNQLWRRAKVIVHANLIKN